MTEHPRDRQNPPDPELTVAVDATPLLATRTGVGHAAAALIGALARRGDLDLRAYSITWAGRRDLESWLPEGVAACTRRFPARVARALWRHSDHPRAEHWTGPVDVVHGTNFVVPPSKAAAIVTVHDLTCVRFPGLCARDTLEYPNLIRRALARGATVHVVSDTVGEEVREVFALPTDRVVRIYPGLMPLRASDPAAGRRLAKHDRYVLALGAIEPRKRLDLLVRAFDAVAAHDHELGLVLAGPDGWGAAPVHEAIAAAGASERIVAPGYVDETDRADLLAGAAAFAYPSAYEGFGHPPLEAMSLGVPVVATNVGALAEVLGDAALLVDPSDPEALTHGLARVVGDEELREVLARRGRARAARYSWDDCAREMATLYRRVKA